MKKPYVNLCVIASLSFRSNRSVNFAIFFGDHIKVACPSEPQYKNWRLTEDACNFYSNDVFCFGTLSFLRERYVTPTSLKFVNFYLYVRWWLYFQLYHERNMHNVIDYQPLHYLNQKYTSLQLNSPWLTKALARRLAPLST